MVTEEELEEEEKRKVSRLVKIVVALLCLLLLVIVVPIAILVPKGKRDVEITDAPTNTPTSMPTSQSFSQLLTELRSFYNDDDEFMTAFSVEDSPQSLAAEWVTAVSYTHLTLPTKA